MIWLGLAQLGEAFSLLWNHEEMRGRLGVDVFEHEHLPSRQALRALHSCFNSELLRLSQDSQSIEHHQGHIRSHDPASQARGRECLLPHRQEREDLLVLEHHRGGDFPCYNFVEDGAGVSVPMSCAHKRMRHGPLPQHTRIAVTLVYAQQRTGVGGTQQPAHQHQHQTLRKN